MLKKILPFALGLALIVPTIAGAATIAKQASSPKTPYATEIKAERKIIKNNCDTNQALRVTIKEKLAKIKTLISQDKADKTLKAKKETLKSDRAVVKADRASLEAIRDNLKPIWDKAKIDKAAKDYASLLTDLKAIPDLQTSKTTILTKLNSDLDSIITLLSSQS